MSREHAQIPQFKGKEAAASYDLIPAKLAPANHIAHPDGTYGRVPVAASASAPVPAAKPKPAHYVTVGVGPVNALPPSASAYGVAPSMLSPKVASARHYATSTEIAAAPERSASFSAAASVSSLPPALSVSLDGVPAALQTRYVGHDLGASGSVFGGDVAALEALPVPAFLSLIWAAFAAHAAAPAHRGVHRLVEVVLRSPVLAERLPLLLVHDEPSAVATELARRCRAVEPLVALLAVATLHALFKRIAVPLVAATTTSFAFESVAGVALRAFKTRSPLLFAEAWLMASNDVRTRMPLLIAAHAAEPYDASLAQLLCFDAALDANREAERRHVRSSAPPKLQRRKSTALQLTDAHSNMIQMLAGYNADQLASALRDTLLGESGTHSDDDDDDGDDDVDDSKFDVRHAPPAPTTPRKLLAKPSLLNLVLFDDDTEESDDSDRPAVSRVETRDNDVWTMRDVKRSGQRGNDTLDDLEPQVAQLRQLRARVVSSLGGISANEFAAITTSEPLLQIFRLYMADRRDDLTALVARLRGASAAESGGAKFDRLCGEALRALPDDDVQSLLSVIKLVDAAWLVGLGGAELEQRVARDNPALAARLASALSNKRRAH